MVGTDINTKDKIKGAGSWSGTVHNLVIWNSFLNPLMLKETSERKICEVRAKTDAWLTFEEIIAGCTDPQMYQLGECSVESTVQSQSPIKRSAEQRASVSVDYDSYLNDPSDYTSWMITSEESVSVYIPTGSTYAVKRRSNQLGRSIPHFWEPKYYCDLHMQTTLPYNLNKNHKIALD